MMLIEVTTHNGTTKKIKERVSRSHNGLFWLNRLGFPTCFNGRHACLVVLCEDEENKSKNWIGWLPLDEVSLAEPGKSPREGINLENLYNTLDYFKPVW